jgi:hypothetical protein
VPTAAATSERPARSFEITSAYPNPFSTSTAIHYALSKSGFVRVTVYDVQGRSVEKLLARRQTQGDHELVWDASEVSAGVYFVKVNFEASSATRKLVVRK